MCKAVLWCAAPLPVACHNRVRLIPFALPTRALPCALDCHAVRLNPCALSAPCALNPSPSPSLSLRPSLSPSLNPSPSLSPSLGPSLSLNLSLSHVRA